jgi:hypothetical protein
VTFFKNETFLTSEWRHDCSFGQFSHWKVFGWKLFIAICRAVFFIIYVLLFSINSAIFITERHENIHEREKQMCREGLLRPRHMLSLKVVCCINNGPMRRKREKAAHAPKAQHSTDFSSSKKGLTRKKADQMNSRQE